MDDVSTLVARRRERLRNLGPLTSAAESPLVPPPLAVLALNRMGFGPRPGDVAAFNALGSTDDARIQAYVAQQTAPGPDDQDTEYWNRRVGLNGHTGSGFTTLYKTLTQLWVDHRINGYQSSRPVDEVRLDTYLRMVHSKWQLREVLVDFWMNHFNVYGYESYTRETFVHWNRDVIRQNVFGNFRTMLGKVAHSTTMLYYLDNYTNTRSGPNENWARELFELHTMGSENYLGVLDPTTLPQVEMWPPGTPWAGQWMPQGYVDNDVYEAARCFTGWGVDSATGVFEYDDSEHDRFSKTVLNFGVLNIPADQAPEKDGNDVLDLLSAHPGTARHIARKLCRRLVSDDPPASLVDSVADLFNSTWQAGNQLRQVVTAILLSQEFRDSWGLKVKRPLEFAMSALRAAQGEWLWGWESQDPLQLDSDTSSFISRLSRTGQNLFARVPPDGFPDLREDWASSNTRVQCWRLAGWFVDQRDDNDNYRMNVVGVTQSILPIGSRSANDIVNLWIYFAFYRDMDVGDRADIVDFMAAGANPNTQLDLSDSGVANRLRSLVALLFMSPDFFLR